MSKTLNIHQIFTIVGTSYSRGKNMKYLGSLFSNFYIIWKFDLFFSYKYVPIHFFG